MAQTAEITNAAPLAVIGRLVRQPFGPGGGGYSTALAGTSSFIRSTGLYPNPDGSGGLYLLTAKGEALTTAGIGASLKGAVQGSTVGIAFVRFGATPNFDVVIDGVAYAVNGAAPSDAGLSNGRTDHYGCVIFTDLGEGPHDIQIVVTGSGVPGDDRSLYIYGLLVEERYGGRSVTPCIVNTPVSSVPTTAGSIPYNNGGLLELRGISRVDYYNTDTGPLTVTIKYGGNIVWSETIAAGGKASWTPPGALAQQMSPNFTHETTVASKINSITYGPYQ